MYQTKATVFFFFLKFTYFLSFSGAQNLNV